MKQSICVKIGNFNRVFRLTDVFCPVCGNQTVYNALNQSVHFVCACGNTFQLRPNTRGLEFDAVVSEAIRVENELSFDD